MNDDDQPTNSAPAQDPAGPDGVASDPTGPDLEEAFARWDEQRPEQEEAPSLAFDPGFGVPPDKQLAAARRGALIRLLLLSLLTVVGLATLVWNLDHLRFFMQSETDVVDYGDIRARWQGGERPGDGKWPDMEHNTWVSLENGIMTNERQAEIKARMVYFFFEPMTKTLIITRRQLPDKDIRRMKHAEIELSFTSLQQGRWLEPGDLSAGFSAKGRLFKASRAPRRWSQVVATYRADLDMRKTLNLPEGPPEDFWVLVDEVTPRDSDLWRRVIIMGCAILVMLLSFVFWIRARRKVQALELAAGLQRS